MIMHSEIIITVMFRVSLFHTTKCDDMTHYTALC